MSKKLDHIIVVDLEATCWEGTPPEGEINEVIEIGVCRLELSTMLRSDKKSILVKPTRSKVSEYCTKLTTLTQEQVDQGVSFLSACAMLRQEYRTRDRVWASFGDYDRKQFERQCATESVPYPFGSRHINVKTLFAVARGLPHEVGTAQAIEMLGRTFEGTQHRGDDDAWNIAAILSDLIAQIRRP
jgi:inhibitor of KinA sporulation pathway (predicted exonuclease)